jgi:hypothetical protein
VSLRCAGEISSTHSVGPFSVSKTGSAFMSAEDRGETPEPHTVPAPRCRSDASPELDPAKIDDRLFPPDRCGLAKAAIAERWKRCLRGQPAEASADNYDPWPARREGGGTIVSMRSNIPSMLGLATRDQSGGVTAQLSGAELVGEFRKPVHDYVGRGVGYGIGRAGGSPLVGSAHKGSAIADAAGRIEVEIVARPIRISCGSTARSAAARR